ncbi:iron ABC transporter permease [Jeongeupia wiesaeckerbachi]|uniref:iron ABC transporter permease n=1 Tax=Jeongeupia wiesaeckerbachi TaxID=3051218 RepID=UPI003D807E99
MSARLMAPLTRRRSHDVWLLGLGLALLLAIAGARIGQNMTQLFGDPTGVGAEGAHIYLFELRLPRVLAALLAGGALGVSGALFQSLTRNPLAAPDLLGVTGGAQLGVFAAMMLPALAGVGSVPLLFTFGLGAAALTAVTAGGWHASPLRLILAGTACSLLFGAIINMLLTVYEESIAGVALWSNGAMYQSGMGGVLAAAPWVLLPLLLLPVLVRPLEVAALGDESARSLGVPLQWVRVATVLTGTALAAAAVAVAGPLGFVGLIAPNLLRAARVHRLRLLLPLAAVWGALILLATDSLVVGLDLDTTVSTGVMVALIGTPLLLALIYSNRRLGGLDAGASASVGGWSLPFVPVLLALVAALVAVAFAAMAFGSEWLPPSRWLAGWTGQEVLAGLLIDLRLPRVLVAMIGGAMLAASGALLQGVVKNPLAGPEILGITQGAALGGLISMVLAPLEGRPLMFAASFIGGGAVLALTLLLNRRHRLAPLPVALTGIALGAVCTALAQWVIVQNSVQPARFLVWLIGGTYGRSWNDVFALGPWLLLALPVLLLLVRPLELLALGEDSAAALGVPVARLRLGALLLGAMLACAAVATVGPVAFVGLMTPHLARLLGFHSLNRRLPVAMLLGALLLAVADVLGRMVLAPIEVPAGVTTALIGAPYLLGMLIFGQRRARAR